MGGLIRALDPRRVGATLLDLLLPPRCLKCGVEIGGNGALCAECWRGIAFLHPPCCARCGLPFEIDLGAEAICGACARETPLYARARAALRYDEASRTLVLAFKHGDKLQLAPALGRFMRRAGAELLATCDVIAPVPLHWTRLFTRRYNQAAILAHALVRDGGPPVVADLLERRRATPPQGRSGRTERRRNVRGAFSLKRSRAVTGRRVLLVDDVLTTGATVSECARTLLDAGAESVDVLTLARTVRPDL
ncbi:MAG TPA: ComF family protein [Stellaceae bacterium]|nr:ComF family protein [Stellaceae bacterium]